jgi:porin
MSISLQYPADSGSRRGFSMALIVGSMMAMATSSPVMADDWMDRSTMTGDWEGSRSRLAAQGVKITGDYSGETVYNAHGGKQRGTRYSQNIKLGAQFDLGKLLNLESGGKIS